MTPVLRHPLHSTRSHSTLKLIPFPSQGQQNPKPRPRPGPSVHRSVPAATSASPSRRCCCPEAPGTSPGSDVLPAPAELRLPARRGSYPQLRQPAFGSGFRRRPGLTPGAAVGSAAGLRPHPPAPLPCAPAL